MANIYINHTVPFFKKKIEHDQMEYPLDAEIFSGSRAHARRMMFIHGMRNAILFELDGYPNHANRLRQVSSVFYESPRINLTNLVR